MINAIELTNFRSHKDTFIEFHPGVNVIKGTSHSGKTNIVRAIKWVLLNRPSGTGFIPFTAAKGDETAVSLQLGERFISRIRGKENAYETDEDRFPVVRTDVPDEVKDVLKMDETNISEQQDGPYLLNKPSGEVARIFNECVGLSDIDRINKNLNSITKQAKRNANYKKEEEERISKILAESSWVVGAKKRADSMYLQIDQINKMEETRSGLEETLSSLSVVNDRLAELKDTASLEPKVDKLIKSRETIDKLINKYNYLLNLIEREEETTKKICNLKESLVLEPRIRHLESIQEEIESAKREFRNIERVHNLITVNEQSSRDLKKQMKQEEKKLNELMDRMGICPLCGSQLKGTK